MAGIRQVNIRYLRAEDRILMRVTVGQRDEYRFWLTRACMRQFVPQAAAWLSPENATPTAAVRAFAREAAAAQADYSKPLAPGESYPLGAAPLLVVKLRIESSADKARLLLQLADGRLVTLNIEESTLAAIQRLLHKAVANADWGLPTVVMPTPAPAENLH